MPCVTHVVGFKLQPINQTDADIVLNVALPYQNIPIMEACLARGAHYIDTAVPETPERLYTNTSEDDWYGPQWNYHERFEKNNLTAILGAGSDPGMVNVFTRYLAENLLDEVETIDILDVNAGDHGQPFATNFNPEINLREVQAPAHYIENGEWKQVPALSLGAEYDFPVVGKQPIFLMDHDELHSLERAYPNSRHIRFWMGFNESYIKYFNVLKTIGVLSPHPVTCQTVAGDSVDIVPLQLLKEILPDPSSLAETYTGKTCIGTLVSGKQNGEDKT